jgi:hypothetical protein
MQKKNPDAEAMTVANLFPFHRSRLCRRRLVLLVFETDVCALIRVGKDFSK